MMLRKTLRWAISLGIILRPQSHFRESPPIPEKFQKHTLQWLELFNDGPYQDLTPFLIKMLVGHEHFRRREALLRALVPRFNFFNTIDALNRIDGERLAASEHFANYLIRFQRLKELAPEHFSSPLLFLEQFNSELKNLKPHLPDPIFKKVTLISHYCIYEQWTSVEAMRYWLHLAEQENAIASSRIEKIWETFFLMFPKDILQSPHYHQKRAMLDIFLKGRSVEANAQSLLLSPRT